MNILEKLTCKSFIFDPLFTCDFSGPVYLRVPPISGPAESGVLSACERPGLVEAQEGEHGRVWRPPEGIVRLENIFFGHAVEDG